MAGPAGSAKTRTPEDLFSAFFVDVTGEQLSEAQHEVLAEVLTTLSRADREVAS
jgi:hypothetical protein